MLEKFLRVIQKILAGLVATCIVAIFFASARPVAAANNNTGNSSARRLGGQATALGRMSMDDFGQKHANLSAKLHAVAKLDDVQIICGVSDMSPDLIDGINVDDGVDPVERDAMLYNTWMLQNAISCAPSSTAIYLPAGTFYFVSGHLRMADGSSKNERHVIKPVSNVSLVGAGTEQNRISTTLKPYSEITEFKHNARAEELDGPDNAYLKGGLDMFFFNNYAAYGFKTSRLDNYLVNANFYDFIIDSEKTIGDRYTSSGKGFMINLFRDCEWDNVTVMNTDGTGFGVDAPINGRISNSRAIGCGKGVKNYKDENGNLRNPQDAPGASGFGIGTGYSNNESMVIRDSEAINNWKFGFFYEHQDRFTPGAYPATSAASVQAFQVINGYAEGNMYNYGGLRANDVYYSNSKSKATSSTILDVYFSDESRRVSVDNISITGSSTFSDADYSSYYGPAVKWATQKGITNGVSSRRFGVGQTIRRADAVIWIWRLANRAGDVLSVSNNNIDSTYSKQNINVCFADVPGNEYYSGAVLWAYNKGITTGTKGCSSSSSKDGQFSPDRGITRAEFVTMLWRLAGSPAAGQVQEFSDVTDKNSWYYQAVQWAAATGITSGIGDNKFGPDIDCTREQAITFLHRFSQKVSI